MQRFAAKPANKLIPRQKAPLFKIPDFMLAGAMGDWVSNTNASAG